MASLLTVLARPAATTLCRSLLAGALLGGIHPAAAAGGEAEAALVRAALAGPVLRAEVAAARAAGEAQGRAGPLLPNPVLEGRHERANGPAGAVTNALGGSLSLDLGFSGLSQPAVAAARAEAGWHGLRAEAVDAICALRSDIQRSWLASRRAEVATVAHERLAALQRGLDTLAEAGELAGYDRARSALSVAAHGHDRDARAAEALALQAGLAAVVGRPVHGVELEPLPPAGALERSEQAALAADPHLAALRSQREAATRALAAARRGALPDLAVAVGGRWDALPDGTGSTPGFEVGAGLELPLFDRHQVELARARADLVGIEAALARREAEVRAAVEAAWQQVERLGPAPPPVAVEGVWQGARDRYASGEASIDELLAVARDVEAAELAALDARALRHRAWLDLSCAAGAFPEPELQAVLEELTR